VTNIPINRKALTRSENARLGVSKHPRYGSEVRHYCSHIQLKGVAPLVVVDEAHMALPVGKTPQELLEWYAMHRHSSSDVVLISQTYRKIHRDVADLAQHLIRCRKATALGSSKKYIRKTFDGPRGEQLSQTVRTYKPEIFPVYKSYTKGGAIEAAASDIKSIWTRWPFIALACLMPVIIYMLTQVKNPMAPPNRVSAPSTPHQTTHAPRSAPGAEGTPHRGEGPSLALNVDTAAQAVTSSMTAREPGPFGAMGLHIVGHLSSATKSITIFALSQNGQQVTTLTDQDLRKSGYEIRTHSSCAIELIYGDDRRWLTCDAPQVQIGAQSPAYRPPTVTRSTPAPITPGETVDIRPSAKPIPDQYLNG
jgi:zona occludens toxin